MHLEKINCLAVDDEPPALEVLKKYIANVPSLELVTTCADALEAMNVMRHQQIDLLFLDIQMPQLLGTDFLRTLKNPPKVVFTTAYRRFALEGFELDAVDYLLKPISFERFLKAINKVIDTSFREAPKAQTEASSEAAEMFIHFRCDRKTVKVALSDILYIESYKDYIKVFTTTATIITKQSISSIEQSLSRNAFLRIHRSYIIALDKIDSYSHELVWIAKKELPISRMYKHEAEKVLKLK